MEIKLLVKIHESSRKVVAMCDSNLLGKKFVEGNFQLEINNHFYEGKEMSEEEIEKLISVLEKDSPSYNIVGEKSIGLFLKKNLILKEGVKKIAGVPYAMIF